jgi:uncharacterized membrane protein required for colicin V production
MSIYLVLDLLLLLLIVLFAPIGYWRGPVKELLVTFGVLFGILLADFWARPWGSDLAELTAVGESGGAFVVAMAFMVSVTFILGYGVGAAIAPTDFQPPARAIGAIVALFNGILLVSFSLQYVRVFLLSDATEEALDDSYVVQFLLDQIGWVLLLAALIGWPLLLVVLITGRRAYEQVDHYQDYSYIETDDLNDDDGYYDDDDADAPTMVFERPAASADTRVFPPRVPTSQKDESDQYYKTEPPSGRSRPTDDTRLLRVNEEREDAERTDVARDESLPVAGETDPDMVMITPRVDELVQHDPEPVTHSHSEPQLTEGYTRCASCRAVLPPDTRVCPVCGAVN